MVDLPASPPPGSPCGNCGATLLGEWCHHCGQERGEAARLSVRAILWRFYDNVVGLDTSFLRTLGELTTRPGPFCSEYVAGRRKPYMSPIGFFFVMAAVYLLVAGFVGRWVDGPRDDAIGEALDDFWPWVVIAMLLPLTFLWRGIFHGSGRNIAENFVFAFFIVGQFFLFELFVLLPLYCMSTLSVVLLVRLPAWIGYTTFAGRVFYRTTWLAALAKMTAATFSFVVLLLLFVAIAFGIYGAAIGLRLIEPIAT